MDKTKAILITILVVLLFGIPIKIGKSQDHILIIHSTSDSSTRANEISRGMEIYRKHNDDFSNTVIIDNYYLDMEKSDLQKCEIYLTKMQNMKDVIEEKKPELVILSGDMAQRLIGIRLVTPQSSKNYLTRNTTWLAKKGNCDKNREIKEKLSGKMTPIKLGYKLQIVFMGVDNVKEYDYYENADMAGIYEHLYVPAVKEALQDLYSALPEEPNGKPANIIVVGDSSSIASQSIQLLKAELSKKNSFDVPLKWAGIKEVSSWKDWQKFIQSANQNNSMIFIAGYDDLVGEQTRASMVRWTEACAKFPVLGGTESFIADGGMLTVAISNQEQGATALELARQLLDKDRPLENIPFTEPTQFSIGMNKSLLDKRGINLPVIYESFSRASDYYQDQSYGYSTDCQ